MLNISLYLFRYIFAEAQLHLRRFSWKENRLCRASFRLRQFTFFQNEKQYFFPRRIKFKYEMNQTIVRCRPSGITRAWHGKLYARNYLGIISNENSLDYYSDMRAETDTIFERNISRQCIIPRMRDDDEKIAIKSLGLCSKTLTDN